MKTAEGNLNAQRLCFTLLVSKFNGFVTSRLEARALETLKKHGAADENIRIVRVPGAFEIPLTARQLAASKHYDAVICLGAVIKGETPHYELISTEVSRGIAQASYDTGIPIVFGILTTTTAEQALARAGTTERDRGAEAARTAIEMATLMKALHETDRKTTGFL